MFYSWASSFWHFELSCWHFDKTTVFNDWLNARRNNFQMQLSPFLPAFPDVLSTSPTVHTELSFLNIVLNDVQGFHPIKQKLQHGIDRCTSFGSKTNIKDLELSNLSIIARHLVAISFIIISRTTILRKVSSSILQEDCRRDWREPESTWHRLCYSLFIYQHGNLRRSTLRVLKNTSRETHELKLTLPSLHLSFILSKINNIPPEINLFVASRLRVFS